MRHLLFIFLCYFFSQGAWANDCFDVFKGEKREKEEQQIAEEATKFREQAILDYFNNLGNEPTQVAILLRKNPFQLSYNFTPEIVTFNKVENGNIHITKNNQDLIIAPKDIISYGKQETYSTFPDNLSSRRSDQIDMLDKLNLQEFYPYMLSSQNAEKTISVIRPFKLKTKKLKSLDSKIIQLIEKLFKEVHKENLKTPPSVEVIMNNGIIPTNAITQDSVTTQSDEQLPSVFLKSRLNKKIPNVPEKKKYRILFNPTAYTHFKEESVGFEVLILHETSHFIITLSHPVINHYLKTVTEALADYIPLTYAQQLPSNYARDFINLSHSGILGSQLQFKSLNFLDDSILRNDHVSENRHYHSMFLSHAFYKIEQVIGNKAMRTLIPEFMKNVEQHLTSFLESPHVDYKNSIAQVFYGFYVLKLTLEGLKNKIPQENYIRAENTLNGLLTEGNIDLNLIREMNRVES